MKFELDMCPATLRPRSTLIAAATMPRGENAKVEKVTEVQLHIELEVDACAKQVEFLFPGAKEYCQIVAGLDHAKGEDRSARTKLPEMNLGIFYREKPVFAQTNTVIKSRAQLKVDDQGEAKLILRPRVKVTGKELAELAQLIEADIRVTMEPTQMDLSEDTTVVTPITTKLRAKA